MANEEQLLYGGLRRNYVQSLSMPRGDTKQFTFAHDLGLAVAVQTVAFTLRVPTSGDTGTIALQLTLADHPTQIDLSTYGYCTITLLNADTSQLAVGSYQFAVEMTDLSSRAYTPVKGTLVLEWDGVHDDTLTGYPSFTTLGSMQSQLEALLAVAQATLVTVAAAASDATVTVADASLFEAADPIYIQTSGATYEAHEVDSIDGDEITLVGTLAAAVAVGNVVQLGVSA